MRNGLPSGEQIEIRAGDQRVVVVEVGGGLRSYTAGGRDVLDGYGADEMATAGRGQVLIPWPNRLEDGAYEFAGSRHQLPLNEPEARQRDPRPRPLGGVGGRGARRGLGSCWSTRCIRSPATRSRSSSASSTRSRTQASA